MDDDIEKAVLITVIMLLMLGAITIDQFGSLTADLIGGAAIVNLFRASNS